MGEPVLIRLQCLLHALPSALFRLRGYTRCRGHHSLHSELHAIIGLDRQTVEEIKIVRLNRFMDEGFEFGERRWKWDIQRGYHCPFLEPSVESCSVEV